MYKQRVRPPCSPRVLAEAERREREVLADKAVQVLQEMGVEVQRENYGLRGGRDLGTWFVSLLDIARYLLVVRDTAHQQFVVLPRRTLAEIQRTIATLGQDRPAAVVDIQEATVTEVK